MKKAFKILLRVAILVVFAVLAFSLFVPVYDFDEPVAFHGDVLVNPYQDVDCGHWHKANFHAHTKRYGGFTNGRDSAPVIDSVYNFFGFSYAGVSDYMNVNQSFSNKENFIPSYEHGWGIFKIHQLCLGAHDVRFIDYPFWQTLSMKQHTLNKLGETSVLAIPAHPDFVDGGYSPSDFKYLSNYRLMEVVNGYCVSDAHWDSALSNGHLVYIIGDDDTHDVLRSTDVANCFTIVNAERLDSESIIDALVAGQTYAVDFRLRKGETLDEKKADMDTTLPWLVKARLSGDTFSVVMSRKAKTIQFIGQNGRVLATAEKTNSASYVVKDSDTYIRTVCNYPDHTDVYLNPVTRQTSEDVSIQRLDHINYWKTAILWSAYVIVIVICVCFLRKRR